jgi:hypothetical protein
MRSFLTVLIFSIAAGGIIYQLSSRGFRVVQIPNGPKFICTNCHFSPGGAGPKNLFGTEVGTNFLVNGNVDWNPGLASLDSDGDGYTNGEELQDPDGIWRIGEPNPGNYDLVSNPGDTASTPPPSAIKDIEGTPDNFYLSENYPNPFNPSTKIRYSIPSAGDVKLEVFNVEGAKIFSLVDMYQERGSYEVNFTFISVPSGIYLYRLVASGKEQVKKMNYLK